MNKPVIKIQFNESFGLYDYKVTKNEIGEIFKPEEGSIVRGITLEEKNTLEHRINELNEKYGEPITIESLIEEYKDMNRNFDIDKCEGDKLYSVEYDRENRRYIWAVTDKNAVNQNPYQCIVHNFFTDDKEVLRKWIESISVLIGEKILRENMDNNELKITQEAIKLAGGREKPIICIMSKGVLIGKIEKWILEKMNKDIVEYVKNKLNS